MDRPFLAAMSLMLLLASPSASPDECASYGPVATLDLPRGNRPVLQNTRFRVGLYPTCGGVEGGPEHRFRIVDARGEPITHKRYFWTDPFLEVTPAEALKPGTWRLQVRRPKGAGELGEWETMVKVRVDKGLDVKAPTFAGIERVEAAAVDGTIPISPCQAKTGKVVRTTLVLSPAQDDVDGPDDLLYLIERRPKGEKTWIRFQTFRPKDHRFSFESRDAWGQTWEIRVTVRDAAGNQTTGGKTATVRNPPKPPGLPRRR